ncbi:MAG: ATP-dependent Clp protease proteolytic subunit, partial [Mangrovibacterium sp.]
ANEIINLLNDEFDTVEGIGGALVASAASYIAVRCSTFSMPENGQFMIHPPSGGEWGKAEELEAYAEMLKNIEADYLKAYQAKAINPDEVAEILAKRTDKWLTANEAKAMGLITEVRPAIKLDKDTQAMAQACASLPKDAFPFEATEDNTNSKQSNMNEHLKAVLAAFGMQATASVADVASMATAIVKERDNLKTQLKESQDATASVQAKLDEYEKKQADEQNAQAEAMVDAAIKDGRLNEKEDGSVRSSWLENFGVNFEGAKAMLENLPKRNRQGEEVPTGKASAESDAWERRQKEIRENSK